MPSKKKLFEIVKNNPRMGDVIEVGGQKIKFGNQGVAQIRDAALAKDVRDTLGQDGRRDAIVIDVPNNDERGIQMFALPRGDWKERIDWSK